MVDNIQMKNWKCKRPMPCGVRPSEIGDCSEPCEAYKNWRGDMIQKWIIRGVVILAIVGFVVFIICNIGVK